MKSKFTISKFLLCLLIITNNCTSAQSNKIVILDTTNSGIPSNHIGALFFDADSNLWVGTTDKGLGVFDGTTWTYYNMANTPALQSDYINDINQHPNGDMWFGTGHGIAVKSGSTWAFYDANVFNYTITNYYQFYIQFDSQGDLFTLVPQTGAFGIQIYRFKNNTWSLVHSDSSKLSAGKFAIDQNDQIWNRNAEYFDGVKWRQLPLPNPDWRVQNDKAAVAVDNNNHVWMFLYDYSKSATSTVFRYDGTTLHQHYSDETRFGDGKGTIFSNPVNNHVWVSEGSSANRVAWYDGTTFKLDSALNAAISSPWPGSFGIKAMCFDQNSNVFLGLNKIEHMSKRNAEYGGIVLYNENGVNLSDFPIGLEDHVENTRSAIHVYPNPAENFIWIESDNLDHCTAQMFNTSGQLMLEKSFVKSGRLDVSNFDGGLYYLKIYNMENNTLHVEKIVVR